MSTCKHCQAEVADDMLNELGMCAQCAAMTDDDQPREPIQGDESQEPLAS